MTDDVVAFLQAAHEEIERVAKAATPGPWESDDPDASGATVVAPNVTVRGRWGRDEAETVALHRTMEWERCDDERIRTADGTHIALHDPQSALARVRAEREILEKYEAAVLAVRQRLPDHEANVGAVAAWHMAVARLAKGHRHTIPGYDPSWAPEGMEVTA